MIVKIAIVGLRAYLRKDESLDDMFRRVPVGTTVYLRRRQPGEAYSDSIEAVDDDVQTIGFVSTPDIRRIASAVTGESMLPVKVSEVCAKDKCLYIKYENSCGIMEPVIGTVALLPGETVFPFTDHDRRLLSLTQMMKAKISVLKMESRNVLPSRNATSLLKTSREYLKYCCTSIDGETTFSRDDIMHDLNLLGESYGELQEVYEELLAKKKDLGRLQGDVKTRVYLAQYKRIKEQAERDDDGGSLLDDYARRLAFRNGGRLTDEVIDGEIVSLSEELANALDKRYVEAMKSDGAFADAVYFLAYSMQSLYIIYTRRIRLEWLKRMRSSLVKRSYELSDASSCGDDSLNQGTIPPELDTPEAHALWRKAQAHGWVDDNLQPRISQKKATLLASAIGEKLSLSVQWKPFELLWGIKDLATKFTIAQVCNYYSDTYNEMRDAL